MKTLLLCTGIVASAFAAVINYPPNDPLAKPLVKLAVLQPTQELRMETSSGWDGTMGSALDDPDAFRVKTFQEIENYALDANAMIQRCGKTRGYLRTRIQALNEHVTFAREELLELPADSYDEDFTEAHAHFYTTMVGLRDAFTQAAVELKECN